MPKMKNTVCRYRGLTITDLMAVFIVIALVFAMAVPSLAKLNDGSNIETSKSNLITLSVAHAMYAMDYNGRQHTRWPDDLTNYGSTYGTAIHNYYGSDMLGPGAMHVGWSESGNWWYTTPTVLNFNLRQPMGLGSPPNSTFGAFRAIDQFPSFNAYLTGRFYDPVFFAPNDSVVMDFVEHQFDLPYMEMDGASPIIWSSYIRSPAALFHPDVLRAPSQGGWQHPWNTAGLLGVETPPLHAAKYADLKTHIIEHHWNQNTPDDVCNPLFTGPFDGCQPYFFNHSIDSSPVALFYDGHVRQLPNTEVRASDQQVLRQTRGVDGLWSRDTPLGSDGYYNNYSLDNPELSHHILTTNGIMGRDTLGPLELTPRQRR